MRSPPGRPRNGRSRNGTRSRTVVTEIGPVSIDFSRNTNGPLRQLPVLGVHTITTTTPRRLPALRLAEDSSPEPNYRLVIPTAPRRKPG